MIVFKKHKDSRLWKDIKRKDDSDYTMNEHSKNTIMSTFVDPFANYNCMLFFLPKPLFFHFTM